MKPEYIITTGDVAQGWLEDNNVSLESLSYALGITLEETQKLLSGDLRLTEHIVNKLETFTPDYMVVVGTNRSAKPIFIEVKGVKSQDSKELIREKAEAMREFERLHGVKAALVQQDSDGKFRTYGDRKTLEAFILG